MNRNMFEVVALPFRDRTVPTLPTGPVLLQRYKQLVTIANSRKSVSTDDDDRGMLLNAVGDTIIAYLSGLSDTGIRTSLVPLLTDESLREYEMNYKRLYKRLSPHHRDQLHTAALAALIAECSLLTLPTLQSTYQLAIVTEISSYMSWMSIIRSGLPLDVDFAAEASEVRQKIFDATQEVNGLVGRANSRLLEMQKAETAFKDEADQTLKAVQGRMEKLNSHAREMLKQITESNARTDTLLASIDTTDERIRSFAKAVREELRIDTARKLWKQRSFSNMLSFTGSALVLLVFLLGLPVLALYELDVVLAILRRIGDATAQGATATEEGIINLTTLSRLVVITIPIALYIWVIKLMVRFNARSLALMDDARERQTMMDTYFHLIEQNAATKEDRALILNALFRPSSTATNDAVDPPNFVELLEKGMGRK